MLRFWNDVCEALFPAVGLVTSAPRLRDGSLPRGQQTHGEAKAVLPWDQSLHAPAEVAEEMLAAAGPSCSLPRTSRQ
eukprot:1329700-Pyramimonas_sp.AAC.1